MTLEKIYNKWLSIQPLSEADQNKLSMRFTVEYNYNSNHLEGNTLTYGQTELLLLFGKVSGEGHLKDFNDMKASEVSVKMMKEEAENKKEPLSQNFIRMLHHTLLREDYTEYRTLPNRVQTSYVIHAGQYKTRPNSVITRYGDRFEYASPEETPALMSDLVDWYNEEEQKAELSPIELAALFHYRYIRIHPFEDGNGRIARLMVNYILSRHGWPMIVVRSRKKQEYLEALHQTDMVVGAIPSVGAYANIKQIAIFLKYFENLVAKEIQTDIDFVTSKEEDLWWYDGEIITTRSKNTARILRLMRERYEVRQDSDLSELVDIMASCVGGLTNPPKIADTFRSVKKSSISVDTIRLYLEYMEDAFVLERVTRYDIKGRKYIDSPFKYYFEDLGLRNARLGFRQVEPTHMMENMLYNELRAIGMKVDVGQVFTEVKSEDGSRQRKTLEIDFVCNRGYERVYIQSAYAMETEEKRNQELASLRKLRDGFRRIVIVNGLQPTYMNEEGVYIINLMDFLRDPEKYMEERV